MDSLSLAIDNTIDSYDCLEDLLYLILSDIHLLLTVWRPWLYSSFDMMSFRQLLLAICWWNKQKEKNGSSAYLPEQPGLCDETMDRWCMSVWNIQRILSVNVYSGQTKKKKSSNGRHNCQWSIACLGYYRCNQPDGKKKNWQPCCGWRCLIWADVYCRRGLLIQTGPTCQNMSRICGT